MARSDVDEAVFSLLPGQSITSHSGADYISVRISTPPGQGRQTAERLHTAVQSQCPDADIEQISFRQAKKKRRVVVEEDDEAPGGQVGEVVLAGLALLFKLAVKLIK